MVDLFFGYACTIGDCVLLGFVSWVLVLFSRMWSSLAKENLDFVHIADSYQVSSS